MTYKYDLIQPITFNGDFLRQISANLNKTSPEMYNLPGANFPQTNK